MEEVGKEFSIFLVAPNAFYRLKIVLNIVFRATYRSVPLKEGTLENDPCSWSIVPVSYS